MGTRTGHSGRRGREDRGRDRARVRRLCQSRQRLHQGGARAGLRGDGPVYGRHARAVGWAGAAGHANTRPRSRRPDDRRCRRARQPYRALLRRALQRGAPGGRSVAIGRAGGGAGNPTATSGARVRSAGDGLSAARRVVVCFHEPHLGGATRSVERIVPLLREMGWEFSFWVHRPSELHEELAGRGWDVDGEPRCIEYSVRAWRLPPGARRRLSEVPAYVSRFDGFLRERSPDLVHANSVLTLAEALIASRRGHAVLLHAHEMLLPNVRGRLLRRTAWRHLDQVVAVSQASAAAMAHDGRMPRIVYEAAPVPERQVTVRERPHPFTVGTVAVVSTRKGSDLFVEAARLLGERSRNGDFRFEMVGAPSEAIERDWAHSVLDRAKGIGITHVPSANVFERFAEWDAFVLPSRADPFPIAMLEAMASG